MKIDKHKKNIISIYKKILNILTLPSFILLIMYIFAILICNSIKIDYNYFRYFAYSFIFILILIIVILFIRKKLNLFLLILTGLFLLFSFFLYTLTFKIQADSHIRNYLAFSDRIETIEYKISSYPVYRQQSESIYLVDADVIKINTVFGSIQSSGKVKITYQMEDKRQKLNKEDIIVANILPDCNPELFYNKGDLEILNIFCYIYLNQINHIVKIVDINEKTNISKIDKILDKIYKNIQRIRERISTSFEEYLTPQVSSLAKSITIGDRGSLSFELRNLFNILGISHLLSISGLHLGIITAGLYFLLDKIGLYRKTIIIITSILIIIFSIIIGERAGIVRATLIYILGSIAYIFLERKKNHFNLLFLAGFLILLFNPTSLFNLGYQLSFLSVFGILSIGLPVIDLVGRKLSVHKKPFVIRKLIETFIYIPIISISVQIFIYPIMKLYSFTNPIFNNLLITNLISIISNKLLIPIFSLFLMLCMLLIPLLLILPEWILLFLSAPVELLGRIFLYLITIFINI